MFDPALTFVLPFRAVCELVLKAHPCRMAKLPGEAHHSADRAWWWDGSRWLPAWSPDRCWWFNGAFWVPVSRPAPLVRCRADAIILAVRPSIAVAAAVLSLYILRRTRPGHAPGELLALGVVGVLAVIALPVSGYVAAVPLCAIGRYLGLVAYVWFLTMGVYCLAMLASAPPGGPDTDTAAGAGLVILSVPVALVIAILAALGVAVRWCRTWLRSERSIATAA